MHATHCLGIGTTLATALLLLACGGGGGDGGGTTTATLHADPSLDGMVDSLGTTCFSPGCGPPLTGDYGETVPAIPNYRTRQLYAFPLGDLPPGVRIVRATLRLYQAHVEGSPFANLGDVVVDHVDYFAAPGIETYDGQTLQLRFGTLSTNASLGSRSLDVTAQVAADWNGGRLWNQYRVYFWKSGVLFGDAVDDLAYFSDAETSDDGWYGEAPELVVQYE